MIRAWWRRRRRRCVCGEQHLPPGTGTIEIARVLHRTDGPCYHCDEYGRAA